MLDEGVTRQLQTYFERISQPVRLVASLDDSAKSLDLKALLEDIAGLTDKISIDLHGDDERKPSVLIERVGGEAAVRFAGLPMGHEFNSLILALLQVGGHPSKESAETIERVAALDGDYRFETYFSLSCQNCPDVVQALNLMSVLNPRISNVSIDGALFQSEVEAREILAVPAVFLNGKPFAQGRMTLDEIVGKLDAGAAGRDAERLSREEPYEVLIVGGGPAGAAAAIYAARKGIRTGVVAERFGGQVLDTMGIENFISASQTEGPKLVAALEQHVGDYDIDVINNQRAVELIPAAVEGGLAEVRFAGGASLKARSVILSTGARWRQMGVPGEAEYRNKGVAYCPHCDGPLFKGKRVAVVGGGNSGVEAAIDLAGLASHVTLLEFDSQLRADAVLQTKLRSLKNVTIYTSAQTTEVLGDGSRVNGLAFVDRVGGGARLLELEGIFVQIGLVPNSEWLKGVVALSPRGEIEVDARGETSVPGVFAAGDVTTVAYKQIVIAMGDGAKASLSAFDYLIRLAPEMSEAA